MGIEHLDDFVALHGAFHRPGEIPHLLEIAATQRAHAAAKNDHDERKRRHHAAHDECELPIEPEEPGEQSRDNQ